MADAAPKSASYLPQISSIVFDDLAAEWVVYDSEGAQHWGVDPTAAQHAFEAHRARLADQARHNNTGFSLYQLQNLRIQANEKPVTHADIL